MAVDQSSEERHPAIHQWAKQLQELADATGLSLRQLAEHVPWSHSTLARYLSGERVVDDAWQLVPTLIELSTKYGNSVSIEPDDIRPLYLQARRAYQEQLRTQRDNTDHLPPSSKDGQPEEKQRDERVSGRPSPNLKIAIAIVGLVGLLAFAGAAILFINGSPWTSPSQKEIKVWHTKIVGTWSAQHQQYLGVFKYRSPDIPGDTDKATYYEGTSVAVVCQARQRRLVRDPTTGKSSAAWNKLSDGYWIPDLYTDLPKVSGPTPPLGIPTCVFP
ncbi:MAG: helix-turn-helix domain-containing protein [Acidobacteria bacterium]|nr:helix-turn-helix domain-containing protein [Acidobacteriota bacterium]